MYLLITLIRNFLYNKGVIKSERHKEVFVLCVGNIRVGGTGKTPMVEYLIRNLNPVFPVAVVSLGYRRRTKGLKEVLLSDSAAAVGDEPKQMKEKFPMIPFVVNKDRNKAIEFVQEHYPNVKVIILDDAYQYRKTHAEKNVLLTEYARPYFQDHILPYGRLRESRKESKRADYIVVTKCPEGITQKDKTKFADRLRTIADRRIFFSNIQYLPLIHYTNQSGREKYEFITEKDSSVINNSPVIVTGIDNPSMIESHVRNNLLKHSTDLTVIQFEDHHSYTSKDIKRMFSDKSYGAVITTDKDAVKLKQVLDDFYILRIETAVENGFLSALKADIERFYDGR